MADDAPASHPLEHKWTLWFDNQKSGGSGSGKMSAAAWGQTLRSVYSFDTVEDFWRLYNNIKPPSWLENSTDLHLFKEGIEPKWEDPECEHGGKWTVLVPKGHNSKAALDTMWLNALLAAVGEQFAEGDEVCGVVVNVRPKQDKVCLWTRTASDEAAQVSVGKQLKSLLDLDSSARVGFMAHSDAKSMGRGVKERYIV